MFSHYGLCVLCWLLLVNGITACSDVSMSTVYVTVPGPTITVSLVAVSSITSSATADAVSFSSSSTPSGPFRLTTRVTGTVTETALVPVTPSSPPSFTAPVSGWNTTTPCPEETGSKPTDVMVSVVSTSSSAIGTGTGSSVGSTLAGPIGGWNTSTPCPFESTSAPEASSSSTSVPVVSLTITLSQPVNSTTSLPSSSAQGPTVTGASTGSASATTVSAGWNTTSSSTLAGPRAFSSSSSGPGSSVGTAFSTFSTVTTRLNATSTSSALPVPTLCGESGNFTLNWDDEPVFTPTEGDSPFPPVFNPYHHLFFSNGYAYIPPPEGPYSPVSPPRMAVFLTNTTGDTGSPNAAGVRPGEVGSGPRASLSEFWFDVFGTWLGCDNEGPNDCEMRILGYVFDPVTAEEVLAAAQSVWLPPCPALEGCQMKHVDMDDSFRGLTGLQIQAFVNGTVPRMWFMDDLDMGWANNTCAAGLLRQRSRKH